MRVAGIPLGVGNRASSNLTLVLHLEFNGADGSTIIDSTGRHTPSLSAGGTRAILGNQLNLDGDGFIRADAQSTASSDFDFSTGDFEIECKITQTSGGYVWMHTADDNTLGLFLYSNGTNGIVVRSALNQQIMLYTAPTDFTGRQIKINVSLTGTRYSLKVDDVEVATVFNGSFEDIGSNGFIIGAYPASSGMTGLIDYFIVKRKF